MKKSLCFFALIAILLLTACQNATSETPASNQVQSAPPPTETQDTAAAPPAAQSGTTEVFCYDKLRIEVSNVCDIRPESMMDDGGMPHDYTVFVCYPGAKATVLDANMNDWEVAEDGQPHAQWGFITLPDNERIRITDEMEQTSVDVSDVRGVAHLESSLFILMFETADTPVEASGVPYDVNGDGLLQTWEFPVPTGETFGLEGDDADLYTAAAKAAAYTLVPRASGDDTMLILPYVNVFGEYNGESGETHYVCGYGMQFYYDLGDGAFDLQNPSYSSMGSGGGPARITLAADGTLLDIQETYDGADNTARIKELCGPLTELADALNTGEDFPMRKLVPTGDELLQIYWKYYFPGQNG